MTRRKRSGARSAFDALRVEIALTVKQTVDETSRNTLWAPIGAHRPVACLAGGLALLFLGPIGSLRNPAR
jgi:hypothetical protein